MIQVLGKLVWLSPMRNLPTYRLWYNAPRSHWIFQEVFKKLNLYMTLYFSFKVTHRPLPPSYLPYREMISHNKMIFQGQFKADCSKDFLKISQAFSDHSTSTNHYYIHKCTPLNCALGHLVCTDFRQVTTKLWPSPMKKDNLLVYR